MLKASLCAAGASIFGPAQRAMSATSATMEPLPSFPIREVYCPAHFGNAYEAMWPLEMQAYLRELKGWGFNRYCDWLTATDVRNPYQSDAFWDLGMEQLDRKKRAYAAAQAEGFALNVMITPNHVYLDQLRPELLAKHGERIQGQLICPSIPQGRKIILDNCENWFRDLASNGVKLSAMTSAPYDYGGCACEKCSPWIVTWAKLTREVHAIASKHHPGIELWMCSWWWTPEEHALINKWAADESPGLVKAMTLHIEYDQTRMKDVAVPKGCRKLAFAHNGYSDHRTGDDIYGKWGPMIAPHRLPQTLTDIAKQGAEGFQLYTEGLFDDCNKAIVAGLSSGKFANAHEVLIAYAQRYFKADASTAERWVDWIAAWGDRRKVDLTKAATEFEELAKRVEPTWRLEHWLSKLKLETIDRAIGSPKPSEWSAEKLKLADEFWAEQEHLNRDVYRLGPMRHVFARKFSATTWYESWQKATKRGPTTSRLRDQT
jgi:hypothetical protein